MTSAGISTGAFSRLLNRSIIRGEHVNFSRLVERSLTAVLSALLCLTASQLQAAERPLNVLLILVDDLAPVISSYGGPVTTPAIDELAQRGVRFSNNYANVPVCGASRASMLGGLAPNATRFLTYDSRLDRDVTGSVSLPAYFKQHGWHTAAIGKVFDVIEDSAAGWTDPVWSPDPDWYGKQPDGRGEHLQAAYIDPVGDGRLPYFERLDVADADYPDGQVAERAVADLQRLAVGTAPFFLAVGFRKPHLPFNAPEQYWQSADTAPTPLPASWHRPAANVPRQALHRSPELRGQYDALPLVGDVSDAAAQEIAGAYHAAVRYIDAQVGTCTRRTNRRGRCRQHAGGAHGRPRVLSGRAAHVDQTCVVRTGVAYTLDRCTPQVCQRQSGVGCY